MARLGYESVLVEELESRIEREKLPFELVSVAVGEERAPRPGLLGLPERGVRHLLARHAPDVYHALRQAWRFGPRTARRTPPASLYYLHAPLQYAAVWLRSRGRAPYIYDAHDFYPADRGDRLWDRVLERLERRCVSGAAEVVTVTDGVAELIEGHFGRRPVVIRNLHDPRIDERPERDLRSELGLGEQDFLFVMPGNAKPGSPLEAVAEALGRLPEHVHLAVVGAGWESDAPRASDRLHFCPPVPPNQIVPYIASADAGLVLYVPLTPDYLHALPNRLFLPLSAGLPLLYPEGLVEVRALAEEHGLGLAVDVANTASVEEAMRRLAEDAELRERLAAGAQRAGELFTWEREEPRLAELITGALGGRRG